MYVLFFGFMFCFSSSISNYMNGKLVVKTNAGFVGILATYLCLCSSGTLFAQDKKYYLANFSMFNLFIAGIET